jgi:hypothetical protein
MIMSTPDVSGQSRRSTLLFRDLGARAEAQREDSQPVEIRVFVRATEDTDYPIELSVVPWRYFPRGAMRLDAAKLTELSDLELDPQAYGRSLGAALFADGAMGGPYRETVRRSRHAMTSCGCVCA